MLERLLVMYTAFMTFGNTGLMAHMVGPPGSGKSSVARQLADLLGVRLHIISVARLNPLETEGVQMPHGEGDEMRLRLLLAANWQRMRDGDIVLFDEFLRGFPEVYNALLDIFTSREVGGIPLPKVFMIAASNSIATYDEALEDRLMHLPVADPRKRKAEQTRLELMLVQETGMHPGVMGSVELDQLMKDTVLPTFDVLDVLTKKKSGQMGDARTGKSIRNLIAQVQSRNIQTPALKALVLESNRLAMQDGKPQFVILFIGASVPKGYETHARNMARSKLTHIQKLNLDMNVQLMELAKARKENIDEQS